MSVSGQRTVWETSEIPAKMRQYFEEFETECGKAWVRIVSKGLTAHDGETDSAYEKGSTANRLAKLRQAARARGEEYSSAKQTTGWRPACDCGTERPIPADELAADPTLLDDFEIVPYEPVPCIVLDMFSGAGTVGLAADRLGRDYIGMDRNMGYNVMARDRIRADAPLLAYAEAAQ